MIRAIHVIDTPPAGLGQEVSALRERDGIVQAEMYRSLAVVDGTREATVAVAILAESEAVYADWISGLEQGSALRALVEGGRTEVYERRQYHLAGGRWAPLESDGQPPVIAWPAAGPVSIVIQGAYQPNEQMRQLTAREIADTRREPGCVFYAWMENVELDNHLMLLEVWDNQRIYDAHWFGRLATGDYRGDSGRQPATPARGEASREFYRQQSFDFHYGRLLPAAVDNYSESILWTAR